MGKISFCSRYPSERYCQSLNYYTGPGLKQLQRGIFVPRLFILGYKTESSNVKLCLKLCFNNSNRQTRAQQKTDNPARDATTERTTTYHRQGSRCKKKTFSQRKEQGTISSTADANDSECMKDKYLLLIPIVHLSRQMKQPDSHYLCPIYKDQFACSNSFNACIYCIHIITLMAERTSLINTFYKHYRCTSHFNKPKQTSIRFFTAH